MQGIQPASLTDNELLRYTYTIFSLDNSLPPEWSLELYARLYAKLDPNHTKPPEYESMRIAIARKKKNTS